MVFGYYIMSITRQPLGGTISRVLLCSNFNQQKSAILRSTGSRPLPSWETAASVFFFILFSWLVGNLAEVQGCSACRLKNYYLKKFLIVSSVYLKEVRKTRSAGMWNTGRLY